MGSWFRDNARQVLADAANEGNIPGDFPVERLILVTGFYKTGNWEAVALSTHSSTGEFDFTIETMDVQGGVSYNWNSIQHLSPDYSTGHRHPPPSPVPRNESLRTSTPRPTTESNDMQFREARGPHRFSATPGGYQSFSRCCHADHANLKDQCIFLHGFRYRERVFLKDQIEELVAMGDWKPSLSHRVRRILKPTPHPTSKATSNPSAVSDNPPSDEFPSSQRGFSAYLESIEGLPDSDLCVRSHQVNANLVVIYIIS
jgi:hypothetical protein